jgi:hypothetical protein
MSMRRKLEKENRRTGEEEASPSLSILRYEMTEQMFVIISCERDLHPKDLRSWRLLTRMSLGM